MTDLRTAAQQALEALEYHVEQTRPIHRTSEAITALRAALAQPAPEPQCSPHPKAPHGFLRNASHTEDRYVCECEYWEPYEAGYQAGMAAALATGDNLSPTEPVALDWLHKWAHQDDGEPETQWHEGYEAARRVVQIHLTWNYRIRDTRR
jgi:hypothetical protein